MIHVALATNAEYVPYCAVAMLSAIEARGTSELTAHVLTGEDVPAADIDDLADLAHAAGGTALVHRIAVADLDVLPSVGRFGPVVWYRLVLPELLVDEDRVLYLDADTLVVRPLEELWHIDLEDAALGAVRNVVEPVHCWRGPSLGLADMSEYFNSGVLLLDLGRVRAGDLMGRAREVACRAGDRLLWPDQDALNVAFSGRWKPIHPRWNCMNSLRVWRLWAEEALGADAVAEALSDPAILHFEGPGLSKPWHYLSDDPRRRQYRSTMARTAWGDTPLADRTASTRLIGRLPMSWRRRAFGHLLRARRLLHRHAGSGEGARR